LTSSVSNTRVPTQPRSLAGSDVRHDLLLGVGGEVSPLIHRLDAQGAAGEFLDPVDEVRHCGREVEVAVGVREAQHELLTRAAAGLVLAVPTARTGRRGERRDCGKGERRQSDSSRRPVEGLTPLHEERDQGTSIESPLHRG
jgi:hypothetical protein